MNDPLTTEQPDALAPADTAVRRLSIGVNPDAPPHAREATAAFIAEYDELHAHVAAHPNEEWVAYRSGQRIGFGTDHLALLRECTEKFSDGLFNVYYIDPCLQYPDSTEILSPPPMEWTEAV